MATGAVPLPFGPSDPATDWRMFQATTYDMNSSDHRKGIIIVQPESFNATCLGPFTENTHLAKPSNTQTRAEGLMRFLFCSIMLFAIICRREKGGW